VKSARQIDARTAGHRPVDLRLARTAHRQRPAGQCVAAEAAQIGQVERRRVAGSDRRREAIAAERTAAAIDRAGDRPSSEGDDVIAIAERCAAEAAKGYPGFKLSTPRETPTLPRSVLAATANRNDERKEG